jgi:hypothetical protein
MQNIQYIELYYYENYEILLAGLNRIPLRFELQEKYEKINEYRVHNHIYDKFNCAQYVIYVNNILIIN